MPTYNVYVKAKALNNAQKQKVAQAITSSHAISTGAPEFYVQVIFNEILDSNRYVSGYQFNRHIWIRGDVRTGRSVEQRKQWMLRMIKDVSESINWDINLIWIDLCGIEPESILKYGEVFPPAGQENKWLKNLPDDARSTLISLTKKSDNYKDEITGKVKNNMTAQVKIFNSKEINELINLLKRLRLALGKDV